MVTNSTCNSIDEVCVCVRVYLIGYLLTHNQMLLCVCVIHCNVYAIFSYFLAVCLRTSISANEDTCPLISFWYYFLRFLSHYRPQVYGNYMMGYTQVPHIR